MIKYKYIDKDGYQIFLCHINLKFVNATKLSKNFNASPMDWIRKSNTINLIDSLGDLLDLRYPDLLKTDEKTNDIWMHKSLAIAFSKWLDASFGKFIQKQLFLESFKKEDSKEDDMEPPF